MTIADKIRDALRAAGRDGLTSAELGAATGMTASKASTHMSSMLRYDQATRSKDGATLRYVLNPDYTPKRARKIIDALPVKRHKKKTPDRKHDARPSATRATPEPSLQDLLTTNLLHSGDQLISVLMEQVDGIENNPQLMGGAIQAHERAQGLYRAGAKT